MGTVLLTGANSSLGLPAVEHLLSTYPSYTAILTVRNTTSSDPNTAKLLAIVAKYPDAKVQLRKLDLSTNADVAAFTADLNAEIACGVVPRIAAIVCNAMTWSLGEGVKYSSDGVELSMAVNHIAQLGLVLRLLRSMETAPGKGRIVFLSSEAHEPKSAAFEVYPPTIPSDLEEWRKPGEDKAGEEVGRGFYRYGVSKLAAVMCSYALARRIKATPKLENIRVLAVDPGGLMDSRAFSHADIPFKWKAIVTVGNALQPLFASLNPKMNRSKTAGSELIDAAVGKEMEGVEGHFLRREKKESSKESLVEAEQERVWGWSVELTGAKEGGTALNL